MNIKARTHLLLAVVSLAMTVAAGERAAAEDDPFQGCRSLGNSDLSEVRGAYQADNGMEFSFGIAKTVLVNGVPLLVSNINLMTGGMLDPESSSGISSNMLTQIQSGANNSIDPTVLAGLQSGTFTFIQNTLDRAVLHNTTTIDVTVTVRNLLRDLNLSSMLSQQLINSMH